MSGILSFKKMPQKRNFVIHTLLIWGMYLGMILLGFQSIAATSSLGIQASLSVLSFGSIGMIATPGGMGAYTLLVDEIVQLYAVSNVYSLAISWIIWLVPTIIIIVGGSLSFILLPIYNRSKHVG